MSLGHVGLGSRVNFNPDLRCLERDRDLPASRVPETLEGLLRMLGGPTLIRASGDDNSRARAVTTLLHGNEPSGGRAIHRWLRGGAAPAVETWIFIGAISAALAEPGFAHRMLPGHRDMNRCWLPPYEDALDQIAVAVLTRLRDARPEALIDIHNNTGHNPAYGVGPSAKAQELALVALFGEHFVHSTLQLGALVEATSEDYPSVTIECGRSGDPAADEVAYQGLVPFLECEDLWSDGDAARRIDVLADPVRVSVVPGVELAFGDQRNPDADLTVLSDIDRHNFERLAAGLQIGWLEEHAKWPLIAKGEDGVDRSHELFVRRRDRLETRCSIKPIMMTTNPGNALLDCLFYTVRVDGDD